MRLLIDTHVLLWTVDDPDRLSAAAKAVMSEPSAGFVVSVATLWEIAIKESLGRLKAPPDLPELLLQMGYEILDVRAEHVWQVKMLPPHHGDPFDRLLVAQAQVEDIPLVTRDRHLERYDVRIIRA